MSRLEEIKEAIAHATQAGGVINAETGNTWRDRCAYLVGCIEDEQKSASALISELKTTIEAMAITQLERVTALSAERDALKHERDEVLAKLAVHPHGFSMPTFIANIDCLLDDDRIDEDEVGEEGLPTWFATNKRRDALSVFIFHHEPAHDAVQKLFRERLAKTLDEHVEKYRSALTNVGNALVDYENAHRKDMGAELSALVHRCIEDSKWHKEPEFTERHESQRQTIARLRAELEEHPPLTSTHYVAIFGGPFAMTTEIAEHATDAHRIMEEWLTTPRRPVGPPLPEDESARVTEEMIRGLTHVMYNGRGNHSYMLCPPRNLRPIQAALRDSMKLPGALALIEQTWAALGDLGRGRGKTLVERAEQVIASRAKWQEIAIAARARADAAIDKEG